MKSTAAKRTDKPHIYWGPYTKRWITSTHPDIGETPESWVKAYLYVFDRNVKEGHTGDR